MPKVVDHAERRKEIVWALWAVIHERGIDGVTLHAVAAEAGVSIGRIQHYFESKQNLIRAGAQEMVTGAEQMYREHGSPRDPGSALAALLTQPVPTNAPARVGVSVWYAYLAKATNDPWIRSFLAEASGGTVGEVGRLLRLVGLSEARAHNEAVRLVAVSTGATQSVLIAGMDADAAVDLVRREIDRSIDLGPE